MINQGVKYLYSDNRIVDEAIDIQPLINQLIIEKGDVRVFPLKRRGVEVDYQWQE